MSRLTNTLIVRKDDLEFRADVPLNNFGDIEHMTPILYDHREIIYLIYRKIFMTKNRDIEVELISYDGTNLGKCTLSVDPVNQLILESQYVDLPTDLGDFIIKATVNIMNYRYILVRGLEIMVLYRNDYSRYNGNFKEVYGRIDKLCRKISCDTKTKDIIKKLYPDSKLTKFSFFYPEEESLRC